MTPVHYRLHITGDALQWLPAGANLRSANPCRWPFLEFHVSNASQQTKQFSANQPAVLTILFHSVEEAAVILGVGRTCIFALIRESKLRSVKVGKRRLLAASELAAFAGRLQEGE